jgi:NADH-quinone oxidoreductase subunit L
MFLAMGVGAYTAGIFHLVTHAFFKALLFLGSGAVIHALAGEQDLRRMGGLKQELPITYWTFVVGAVAIAGVPGLAGFFSKDEILFRTYVGGHTVLWVVGLLTSLLTAVYMFRLVFLAFHGPSPAASAPQAALPTTASAPQAPHTHLHDAPPAMALALILLAVGSAFAGYIGLPQALHGSNRLEQFLAPSFAAGEAGAVDGGGVQLPPAGEDAIQASEELELGLMGVSSAVAVGGIGIAWFLFLKNRRAADEIATRFDGLHRLLANKYYVDELYDATIVNGTMASAFGLWTFDRRVVDGAVNGSGWLTVFASWVSSLIDKYVVDGAVNLVGRSAEESSFVFRRVQTGLIQNYALLMLFGVFAFVSIYLLVR